MTPQRILIPNRRLPRSFFERPTLRVARELLGMELVSRVNGGEVQGRITEVEAYIGTTDQACHARFGRTARNAVMWGPAGHAYIYFTYGMHWLLNVVTEAEDTPAAVLIRALEPTGGVPLMERRRGREPLTAGPAQVTQALGLTGALNGEDLTTSRCLWVARPPRRRTLPMCVSDTHRKCVRVTPRIGVAYAGPVWAAKPWRFVLARRGA